MTRTNSLYVIIGALVVVVIGLGIYVYRQQTKPEGIQMNISENGISVEQN